MEPGVSTKRRRATADFYVNARFHNTVAALYGNRRRFPPYDNGIMKLYPFGN